jgi:hypothetical protein
LLGDPQFLLLDEITSGLDPHGDLEMMHWLRDLVRQTGKTIVLVTHSITNIHFADRLLFLKNGKLIYDGCPQSCLASFQAESWEEVYASGEVGQVPLPVRCADDQSEKRRIRSAQAASVTQQLTHLMKRQLVLFRRDSGQCWLHLLLILTFPILVAVFAADGLPQVTNLSLKIETSVISGLTERLAYLKESFKVSSLVAGLSMFQVILLTLMGANNGAREIAKERDVLAKELRAGLSPLAYITTKAMQVTLLSGAQALWMALFVKTICRFPGELSQQFWILFVCTLAMSGACLMISAASRTPEKASLLAIYLVGLQLPLSGAVLALPEWLTSVTRPFIAAYWGWSGYLRTLESFRHYDAVQQSTTTSIAPYSLSWVILVTHFAILSLLAWGVLHRKKSNVAM